MSTIELRHIINEYLSMIEDASFLNALKTIIESKVTEGTYKLSEYQKNRIKEARVEYETGRTIPDETLNNEMDQWLNTK